MEAVKGWPDLKDWVMNLAQTNKDREKIIKDLLRNANGDLMSEYDRRACRAALTMWFGPNPHFDHLPECKPPFKISSLYAEPEEVH